MNGSLIHKKKGHSRLWSQPSDRRMHPRNQHLKQFQFSSIKKGQNARRLTRSLWPFHDSGVCHSSHNGHYTLSQPSKKGEKNNIIPHQPTKTVEGKRSHLIRSSSRNQLMRKLGLMRRILNLFPKPPIQHKNSNSLFDTLYLIPSLSLMRIIREPSHHDFKKFEKKSFFHKVMEGWDE